MSRDFFAVPLPPQPRADTPGLLSRLAARWQAGWEVYANQQSRAEVIRARLPWPEACDYRYYPQQQRCLG